MRKKYKKGFTLLEIVISLGLMSIILIPTGNMVLTSVKNNKAGENKQQASVLLQETIEYIKTAEELKAGTVLPNGVELTTISEVEGVPKTYSIKSKDVNGYGIGIDGTIDVQHITNEITTPGNIVGGDLGKSNMEMVFKPKQNKMYFTGEQVALKTAIESEAPGIVFNKSFAMENKVMNITVNGKGNIVVNGRDDVFKEHQDIKSRNILMVVNEGDSPVKLTGRINGNGLGAFNIYIYIKSKIESQPVTNPQVKDYIISTIDGTVNVFFLNSIDGIEDEYDAWTGITATSISSTTLYSINMDALKNGNKLESVSLDIAK